ncbi:MAG: peroxiredoxin [Magnetococcales bacterium]|nr:peroxiredoxin [Magnetococcales bacterium]MBF0155793.1 peroxiredoxin [Magnetococcales bacterium]
MTLTVGELVPPITLPDQSGESKPLPAWSGVKGMVLYCYPKDATPGCTTEAREFQGLLGRFHALGWQVVGLSRDSVASHERFCDKQGLSFPLLSDGDGEATSALGVWQEKIHCGKASMGIVRTTFLVGADGRILKLYPKVKASGHAAVVLADVEAMAG